MAPSTNTSSPSIEKSAKRDISTQTLPPKTPETSPKHLRPSALPSVTPEQHDPQVESPAPSINNVKGSVTPLTSGSSRNDPDLGCKRRRLGSDDENIAQNNGSPVSVARSLFYERNSPNDDDDSEDEDEYETAKQRMIRYEVINKIRAANGQADGDRLLYTSAPAKLFEFVSGYDVVSRKRLTKSEEKWVYRGEGVVRFIQDMNVGYDRGIIRMQMASNVTLDIVMCNYITVEEAKAMDSKKGKAFAWTVKDWAYSTSRRTFSLRFEHEMAAMEWKERFEQSKVNNGRVRHGFDVPEDSDIVDVCSSFQSLLNPSAPKKQQD